MLLSDSLYRIYYKGGSSDDLERIEDFALLRASEVTLLNGCNYFSILGEEKFTRASAYTSENTSDIVSEPEVMFKIRCYKNKPDGIFYDAQYLLDKIEKKYGL